MRIPREIFVCLILLVLAVWDVEPRMVEYAGLRDELQALKAKYARELVFKGQHEEIEKKLNAALLVHQENEKRLFPGNIPTETALNQLQDMLKQILQNSGLEIVNFKWGEPFRKGKGNVYTLPVSFMARGEPPQIVEAVERIISAPKALRCPVMTISKFSKDKLVLETTITGYQLLPEVR